MVHERDDDLHYLELADQEGGGSGEGQATENAREVDGGAPVSPPDRPVASEDPGVTAEGQRAGASLDRRLAAETRDDAAEPEPGQLVEPGADQEPDDEPQLLGELDPAAGAGSAEEEAVRVEDDGT